MQSQGSTSSQPSFDSLSSSDSLLFSDSEQAEDDTDVFLTDSSSSVIIGGNAAKGDRSLESPGSQWTCDGFTDKEEEDESYASGRGRKAARRSLDDPARQAPKSQGDLLFAQKVRTAERSGKDERRRRRRPRFIDLPSLSLSPPVSALSSRASSGPYWSC